MRGRQRADHVTVLRKFPEPLVDACVGSTSEVTTTIADQLIPAPLVEICDRRTFRTSRIPTRRPLEPIVHRPPLSLHNTMVTDGWCHRTPRVAEYLVARQVGCCNAKGSFRFVAVTSAAGGVGALIGP